MQAWVAAGGDVIRAESGRWGMDRQVRLVAGSMALASVLVSTFVPGIKWIAGAVGGGLAFSAVTNTCAMAEVLGRLPYNRRDDCGIVAVVAEMNRPA